MQLECDRGLGQRCRVMNGYDCLGPLDQMDDFQVLQVPSGLKRFTVFCITVMLNFVAFLYSGVSPRSDVFTRNNIYSVQNFPPFPHLGFELLYFRVPSYRRTRAFPLCDDAFLFILFSIRNVCSVLRFCIWGGTNVSRLTVRLYHLHHIRQLQ